MLRGQILKSCLDLALTLPWPCFDLSLTFLWICLDLALMAKIGSVTAEILLIWTSLVRPFVASTKLLTSVKDGPRILSLNFGQNQVSNSWDNFWYGQMSPKQMLLGQISPQLLESALGFPRNLDLKLAKRRSVTAEILVIWTNVTSTNVTLTIFWNLF